MNRSYFIRLTSAFVVFCCLGYGAFALDFTASAAPFLETNKDLGNKISAKMSGVYETADTKAVLQSSPKNKEVHLEYPASDLKFIVKFECDGSIKSIDTTKLSRPNYYLNKVSYDKDGSAISLECVDGFAELYRAYFFDSKGACKKITIASNEHYFDCHLDQSGRLETVLVYNPSGVFEYDAKHDVVNLMGSSWTEPAVRSTFVAPFMSAFQTVLANIENNFPWDRAQMLKLIKTYGTPVTNPCEKTYDYIQKIVITE